MMSMKPIATLLTPLLLTACGSMDGTKHVARIVRLPGAEAMPAVQLAAARPIWPASEHDVRHEDDYVPPDYGAFTRLPSYPRTFKVWKDETLLNARGPRRVEIDLARQRGLFLVNEQVAMDFPVCTGSKRKPTPTGTFRITQKNIDHVSNIYDVPMPYFMRLTDYGIGLHVGDVFRTPASHGCIRMTREACVPLYHRAPSGTRVVIRRKGWQEKTQRAVAQAAGLLPAENESEPATRAVADVQRSQSARAEG